MGYDKNKRPLLADDYGDLRVTTISAASTALDPRGTIALTSTSTAGPVVYTLANLPAQGRGFSVGVVSVGATSSPHHINMPSGVFVGATSADMVALSTAGEGATFVAVSSEHLMSVGHSGGVTFSTST